MIKEGHVKTPEWDKAEKMTAEHLRGYDGVKMNDFLFTDKKELEKFKIGTDDLKVPVGDIKAIHYRKSRDGQIVDFWISDEARPLGLVKLVSQNDKKKGHPSDGKRERRFG